MGRVGKIARRTFLIGSAAIVGGVAFGVYKVRQEVPNPLTPEQGASLNAFLVIDQDGITVYSGRAEMGQGAQATLAAMVAEELDMPWEQVRIAHGPTSAAYYNGGLFEGAMPGPEYALGDRMRSLAKALGGVGKLLDLQITGGSTSMRDGFDRLRAAGASAREALKQAAAAQLGIGVDRLATEGGAVVAPDGTRIPYADLAVAAAALDAPQVEPRDPGTWKYLGRAMPRPDIPAKATGTAQFGVDVRLPGMKFASVRMNPHLGGAMRGFDPAPAMAMPGVEAVLDIGDGIAVVARNTWIAIKAAEAVSVDWGPSSNPGTTEQVFDRLRAAFDDSPNSTMRDDGDAAGFAGTVIEAEYELPYLAHSTMEPMTATALFSGDAIEIWSPNQTPFAQKRAVAEVTGLSDDAVTVHTTLMGGGFGRRLEADFSALAARVAMQMQGTPVQVTWSREEDMTHDFYRPGALARMRGAVAEGQATLFDAQIASQALMAQAGARMMGLPVSGPDRAVVEGVFDQPYRIPNYRVRGHVAALDIPIGFWRSVGNSYGGFVHESFIDELAHAAGRDPLDFRLDHVRPESTVAAGVLEAVREMSGWDQPKAPGTGRGVAMTWSFGTPVAQVIEVQDQDGQIRITRAWIAADVGTALDPGILDAQLSGGLMYGLSAAVHGRITFKDGAVEQLNFPDYDALRMHNAPIVETRILQTNAHMGGAGEPGTPPSMPALANALFDLTGVRARRLPLADQFNLVL